jgi:hypothetical protein
VREQGVLLEHRVHVALVGRDADRRAAVDLDRAVRRLVEAGDHPERRRLAATGRPEQGEELAGMHLEVDVVDRDEIPESLGDAAQDDVWSDPLLHVARNIQNAQRGCPGRTKGLDPLAKGSSGRYCGWPMALRLDLLALLLLPLRGE